MGRYEGVGSQLVRPQCAAGIEPEPSEPQQRRAEDREGQVVRPKGLLLVAAPFPEQDRQRQR